MSQVDPIQPFLGSLPGENLTSILDRLNALPSWRPFDERVVKFIGNLSQKILTTPSVRGFPELLALAHWFRKARLIEMAKMYSVPVKGQMKIGRGLAFHLAPSNVDSVFMYSWLLSLLAGNSNLVRVSQKGGVQQDALIAIMHEMTRKSEHKEVADRIVLLTYPHDDRITQQISEVCMVRVIWGGDGTVRAIRSVPLHPMAIELSFADRFSLAALSAKAVIAADDRTFKELIQGFYVDTFWFGQQACSSPRMVVWVGSENEVVMAKKRFWPALSEVVQERASENSSAMVMERLGAVFEYAAHGLVEFSGENNVTEFPVKIELSTDNLQEIREKHCGNGLFVQMQIDVLFDIGSIVTNKDQTLAVFGFSQQEYLELLHALPSRAIDRIVPVGTALAFDPVWDGQELITSFTRIITWPE